MGRQVSVLSRFFSIFLAVFVTAVLGAHAQLGRTITNTAELTYGDGGDGTTILTPPAEITVQARPTPSTIEFFRYAPTAPDAFSTHINGSDYAPGGQLQGPFSPIGAPVTTGNRELDFSGEVPLVPAERYFASELLVVRVIDRGQNGDPDVIETVTIRIISDTGDEIVLRLYESGPDTGEFYAYVPSTGDPTPNNDTELTVADGSQLTATYIDPFDAQEVSVDTALVDPFGRVFDSLTGDLVDGVTVTVVDAATGEPAPVFGIDGFSPYPSTVVTGSTVTDDSGQVYDLEPGQFLFPLMAPGTYRLVIDAPDVYIHPSVATEFDGLNNAPFTIVEASFGGTFVVDGTGPVSFDVPLDPAAELVVEKTSSLNRAAIGDFVPYTIKVENRDTVPAQLRVRDELPFGFRYQAGSTRISGERADDPVIAENGSVLTFTGGVLLPGESMTISYVVEVGAGARNGDAVNAAFAVDGNDRRLSNRAEQGIFIQEDLLRSRLTIVGRVAEGACDKDEDWARELRDGIGVQGVRIYMEDGSYAISDKDGLFHFENVTPGTHVVQVDTATLPQGYAPMKCEENTRYASSATSKFVDSPGGVIWRANFYLERVGEVEQAVEEEVFNDRTEYTEFDASWLEGQDATPAWVYPDTALTPSQPSVNLGIKHGAEQRVRLSLNGQPVQAANFSGRESNSDSTIMLSRWRGVSIEDGRNSFVAEILDADGTVVATLAEEVWYVTEATRAIHVADRSMLVADGRAIPEIAVRLEDDAGRPVQAGKVVSVDIDAPYELYINEEIENEAAVTRSVAGNGGVVVGPNGIAKIRLQPTLQTGRLSVRIGLDNDLEEQISVYMLPEQRDWIVVGLAEGTIGWNDVSGDGATVLGEDDEFFSDGRVAFYAKGMIKGDWLLTMAVDTDKRRGDSDGDFRQVIDPNAYYTLYGDRSYQGFDALSRYPLYLKLEKEQFQLLFGDYNTGFDDTVLSRYNRRLTGLRGVYVGEVTEWSAFVAETDQDYIIDELAADGTSGPYRLSNGDILRQSEQILVETRDRLRPDTILETRTLTRYLDYDIDYQTGELVFRRPVDATDALLNPNVIVVQYETTRDVERNITAGARGKVAYLKGRLEVGVTAVVEDALSDGPQAENELIGVDVTLNVSPNTEVRGEFARTGRDENGEHVSGEAWLIEAIHQSATFAATAYIREDRNNFGLGQQTGQFADIRRYGATAAVQLAEIDAAESGERITRSIQGDVYREENLDTGESRSVAQVLARQDSQVTGFDLGLRAVEEDVNGETRMSVQAIGGARHTLPDHDLTVSVRHEQAILNQNESSLFPQRTVLGLDKRLTRRATLNARHEIIDGENASGNSSLIGLTLEPWEGGQVRAQTDYLTSDAGRRLGATVGVDQLFQIDERWTASLGAARRARIDGSDSVANPVSDPTVNPLSVASSSVLTGDESFFSGYAGLGYRDPTLVGSARVEMRDSNIGTRYAGIFGGARELSQTVSFAGAARYDRESLRDGADSRSAQIRLGVARRPRGEGAIVLNRLDLTYEQVFGDFETWKAVNNFAVNYMFTDATQVSNFWGVKYSKTTVNGDSFDGWTQLAGGQIRHDLSESWDVGLTGAVLWSQNSDTFDYAFGPVIGYRPQENVWLSVGYNFEGFIDEDFEAAEYTRQGIYFKLRFKFDEQSLRGFLNRISPRRDSPLEQN